MASAGSKEVSLREIASRAVDLVRSAGAAEAAARATRSRSVDTKWRDGKIENLAEATERGLSIDIYVDGRYGSVETSDLRPDALAELAKSAVAMTRALQPDPDRRLPDPELYQGRATVDLQLEDPAQPQVTPDERKRWVMACEASARAVPKADAILSVGASVSDGWSEFEQVSSNGFAGGRRSTYFTGFAGVTVKDVDGRRPEDMAYGQSRFRADMASAEEIGRQASERALARLGSVKGKSGQMVTVVENRAAGRLIFMLAGPLSGGSLQQKRSFLEGQLGKQIGSKQLSFADDPLIVKGMGSRTFDSEGLALRRRPIVEDGVLKSYYLDTYYARKLGVAPTSGDMTNIAWKLGDKDLAGLLAQAKSGILITGFVGGNSNAGTGDFSLGVRGFRITRGAIAEPLGEMNVSGNQTELWKRLVAVGNDPFPWDSGRTPSLMFDGVQLAGV